MYKHTAAVLGLGRPLLLLCIYLRTKTRFALIRGSSRKLPLKYETIKKQTKKKTLHFRWTTVKIRVKKYILQNIKILHVMTRITGMSVNKVTNH